MGVVFVSGAVTGDPAVVVASGGRFGVSPGSIILPPGRAPFRVERDGTTTDFQSDDGGNYNLPSVESGGTEYIVYSSRSDLVQELLTPEARFGRPCVR